MVSHVSKDYQSVTQVSYYPQSLFTHSLRVYRPCHSYTLSFLLSPHFNSFIIISAYTLFSCRKLYVFQISFLHLFQLSLLSRRPGVIIRLFQLPVSTCPFLDVSLQHMSVSRCQSPGVSLQISVFSTLCQYLKCLFILFQSLYVRFSSSINLINIFCSIRLLNFGLQHLR